MPGVKIQTAAQNQPTGRRGCYFERGEEAATKTWKKQKAWIYNDRAGAGYPTERIYPSGTDGSAGGKGETVQSDSAGAAGEGDPAKEGENPLISLE